jgi:antitoxin MazE
MSQLAIAKWGNSLALRLPRHVVQDTNLTEGAAVELTVRDGSIVITPVRKKLDLDTLLAQMTPDNQHAETDWGEQRGGEVW